MTLTDWMQLNTFQSRRSIVPFVFCLKAVCFQMDAIILSWQRASLWSRRGRQSLPVSHLSAMNVEYLLIYDESLLSLLCFVVKVNHNSFDYGLKIIVIVFVINEKYRQFVIFHHRMNNCCNRDMIDYLLAIILFFFIFYND